MGERTFEGFFRIKGGLDLTIQRAWAYAPSADLIWFETSEPNMEEAWKFATNVRKRFPGKMLAYNCSPSFNWKRKLSDADIAKFQRELGGMGYKYQFITLSAFHAMNLVMFDLAKGYKERGMSAYADLQAREFAKEQEGYRTAKHQSYVGVG
jgi:isocitrate lyase